MPNWLRMTLIVVSSVSVILVIAEIFANRTVQRGVENLELGAEQAASEGKEYGAGVTMPDCVEEGAQRTSDCSLANPICAPLAGAFLWGCLEAAPFDQSFCNTVPDVENDIAVDDWSRRACSVHGEHGNDYCAIAMAVVPGFCSARFEPD